MYKKYFIWNSLIIVFSFLIISIQSNIYTQKNESIPTHSNSIIKKTIYLTFDDGPSHNTLEILNILDQYEITATFFVVGPYSKAKNDSLKAIISNGHEIALHSYSHEYEKIYSSLNGYLDDFYKCLDWIEKVTNIKPLLYRFPGGSSNTIADKALIHQIIASLEKQGFHHVDWNIDSLDSKHTSPTQIIEETTKNIEFNEKNKIYSQTILLHDNSSKKATLLALPSIIEYCLKKGYEFKKLDVSSNLIQHVKKASI